MNHTRAIRPDPTYATSNPLWWQRGIIYQVYPRSFQDSNGDGVGDLQGIRRRLDYLTWLGIDAIWISPIYPSPMADFGYDVADYCAVAPIFGTLADFDALVADAHERGLKVILDFVPNHTSERHPWFVESRMSRDSPRRDWYLWRDGKPNGAPPNNWVSQFGGPAWTYDQATRQWYLHSFLREQPDLNWRNPAVRAAMMDVMDFWLRRGVDGFRVDVIWLLIKDEKLRDNPRNPGWHPGQAEIGRNLQVHNADQPGVHDVIGEMRTVLDRYPDRVLIGEIYLPLERLVAYYGQDLSGAHLPFNFQLIQTAWNAPAIARLVEEYEKALPPGGWPNWVLGNHDQPRIAARVGAEQARVAAMLLLTLRGTPTLYYGDEIGLARVAVAADAVQDPWEKNEPGLGLGRDPSRTPMQWDGSRNSGFSDAERLWLPLDAGFRTHNVAALQADSQSLLNLYRALIALRHRHSALSVGSFRLVASSEQTLIYERAFASERIVIALNFSAERQNLPDGPRMEVLLSTRVQAVERQAGFELGPNEGIVAKLG
ncbi:MAG TPA: alpha-amylase family glycosyl hydrolase [Rhizomicrobium sp.]